MRQPCATTAMTADFFRLGTGEITEVRSSSESGSGRQWADILVRIILIGKGSGGNSKFLPGRSTYLPGRNTAVQAQRVYLPPHCGEEGVL